MDSSPDAKTSDPDLPASAVPRLPILLVHGLGGFDQIRLELIRRHPLEIPYFRGVPETLRAAGVADVFAAALPPGGSVADRGAALASFVRGNMPDGRFHIVAHSMGGLDARHYIANLGGGQRVASLTTLGAPHRGSALACITADYLLGAFEGLIGRLGLAEAVKRLQAATAAHRDLRPDDCARFNEATPDDPRVAYFSRAGEPSAGLLTWILLLPYQALLSGPFAEGNLGPNDGLVTVASAHWGTWRGAVPADHLGLVGWQFTPAQRKAFDVAAFYRSLLPDLADAEAG
jgi:triacylglycerol lipase